MSNTEANPTAAAADVSLDPRTLNVIRYFYDRFVHPDRVLVHFDDTYRDIADALRSILGDAEVTIWVPHPTWEGGGPAGEGAVLNPAFTSFPGHRAKHIAERLSLDETRSGRTYRDGKPRLYRSLEEPPHCVATQFLAEEGLTQMWAVPLSARTQQIGRRKENPHNVIAIALVMFADGARAASIASDTVQLFGHVAGGQIERALWTEQDLLVQKTYEVLDILDKDRFAAMDAVAHVIADATRFEACTILQADEPREVLSVLGTTGISSDVPRSKMKYPFGFSCSGYVAQSRKTYAAEDLQTSRYWATEPRYTDIVETKGRFQYVGTPILSHAGGLLGVIRLRNKRPPSENGWPVCLNYLDHLRIERVSRVIAPVMSLMIKESDMTATMERIRHDIDMPAISIRNAAGLLVRRSDQALRDRLDEVRQKLEDIQSFAEILLTNSELMGLLNADRIELHCEHVLLLGDVVAKICKMLTPEAQRKGLSGILYNADSFSPIPALWLDQQMFEIALYNLIQNAIKYSDEKTFISLEGAVVRDRGRGWYVIHIKNRGIGVDDDETLQIFDYHYRSPRAQKRYVTGLGIGLTTARAIVAQHEGRLELTRQQDPTVFSIMLPAELADRRPNPQTGGKHGTTTDPVR